MADESKQPAMDERKRPAVTDRAGMGRIIKAVQYVERQPRNNIPQAGRRFPQLDIRHAKVTSTISARSTNTLGIGSADLYRKEDRTLIFDDLNVDVHNPFASPITANTWILVVVLGGTWEVLSADCP